MSDFNKEQVFWCGSVLNHAGLERYKGETPAATQWSRGLITGIQNNEVNVKLFAPVWDALFPKGKLFPGDAKYLDESYNQTLVKYINAPVLRTSSVALSLKFQIKKALGSGNKPLAILNYNTYPHYVKALKSIKKEYPDIPWINIVLDLDDPLTDNWGGFLNDTKESDGCVFLSWWGYQNAPVSNKLHLDSGWSGSLPVNVLSKRKKIIYAGKLFDYGGVQDVVDAISLVADRDVEFIFYGKGSHEGLNKLAAVDSRVVVKGFVSDDELHKACCEATGFLSPRDVNYHGTKMIFPSKILFYLQYRKPIISQLLPGLSPDYKKLLIQPDTDEPVSWARSIEKILNFAVDDLTEYEKNVSAFLLKKTWDAQGNNLINFIKSLY
ncbi:glycosyltransferase family 4 protein [Pedobacter sp. P26]|uniref:glycosyltransferase family 4 protein n=1 Tax=Pedobacter sp. P26 TaxID=3423956 RepID=UPI003D66E211